MTSELAQSRPISRKRKGADWARTVILGLITLVVLSPILVIFGWALRPRLYSDTVGPTLDTFAYVIEHTDILVWLKNSLIVSVSASCLSLLVAAPAGYVLSRARRSAGSLSLMPIFF